MNNTLFNDEQLTLAESVAQKARPLVLVHDLLSLHQLMTSFKMHSVTLTSFATKEASGELFIHTRPISITCDDKAITEAGGDTYIASCILKTFGISPDFLDEDVAQLVHWLEGDFVSEYLDAECPINYGNVIEAFMDHFTSLCDHNALSGYEFELLCAADTLKAMYEQYNEFVVTTDLLEAFIIKLSNSDLHSVTQSVNQLCRCLVELREQRLSV